MKKYLPVLAIALIQIGCEMQSSDYAPKYEAVLAKYQHTRDSLFESGVQNTLKDGYSRLGDTARSAFIGRQIDQLTNEINAISQEDESLKVSTGKPTLTQLEKQQQLIKEMGDMLWKPE